MTLSFRIFRYAICSFELTYSFKACELVHTRLSLRIAGCDMAAILSSSSLKVWFPFLMQLSLVNLEIVTIHRLSKERRRKKLHLSYLELWLFYSGTITQIL